MRRKLLATILSLVMVFSLVTPVTVMADAPVADDTWYSSGGANDEWIIYDVGDMLAFAQAVNNGTTFAGKTVKLGADIDMSEVDSFMIGNPGSYQDFQGTFDGDHKTISSLKVTAASGTRCYGMFANANNATIKDFTLVNPTLTNAIASSQRSGIVLGSTYTGTVVLSGITVTGGIVTATGTSQTGGLVGTSAGNLTVSACSVDVTMNGTSQMGGLLGAAVGAGTCMITNCTVSGSIAGANTSIGGIVGSYGSSKALTITNCTVLASVATTTNQVAGILGGCTTAAAVQISDCAVYADITASGNPGRASGIVGQMTNANANVTVTRCDYAGTITSGNILGGMIGQGANGGTYTVSDSWFFGKVVKAAESTGVATHCGNAVGYIQGGTLNISGFRALINNTSAAVSAVYGTSSGATRTLSDNELLYNGTPTITVSSAQRLVTVAYGSKLSNFSNITVALGASVDMAGVDFPMIGSSTLAFQGTFNGASGSGYAISNLTVSTDSRFTGMFAQINGTANGSVYDLTLIDPSVTSTVSNDNANVGILAGYVNAGSYAFNNVTVTNGTLDASNGGNVGGLIGLGNATSLTVTGCSVSGSVEGAAKVGGLVGQALNCTAVNVRESTIGVDVTGTGNNIGGIVGLANNTAVTVETANVTGDVTTHDSNVGGIVGFVQGTSTAKVTNTHFGGSVSSTKEGEGSAGRAYAGGIVGSLATSSNCLTATDVLMDGTVTKSGNAFIGGIVGAYGTGGAVALTRVLVTGTVEADSGCIGAIIGNNTAITGTITDSYALDSSCAHGNGRGGFGAAITEGMISDGATILSVAQLAGVHAYINAAALFSGTGEEADRWTAIVGDTPQLKDFKTGTTVEVVYVDDISEYRGATYTAPVGPDGTIFAGWYEDAELAAPIGEEVVSGSAYAKFVDANVLSLRFQLRAGTDAGSETTKLRALTTVDGMDYQKIQFVVTYNAKEVTVAVTKVYSEITATNGDETITYRPNDKKAESEYYWSAESQFITAQAFNVKNASFGTPYTFAPKWVTHDGTTVSGTSRTVTVNDLIG